MKRQIFGFEIDDNHRLAALDQDGENMFSWRHLLAQEFNVFPPSSKAEPIEFEKFEIAVDQAVVDFGCAIVKVQTNLWFKYYVCTLSCQFGMDQSITASDQTLFKTAMRKRLRTKLMRFCAVMEIDWTEPDWISIRA